MKRLFGLVSLAATTALVATPLALASFDQGGVGGTAWVNTGVSCGGAKTFWHNIITGAWICTWG